MNQNGKLMDLLRRSEALGIPSLDCAVYRKGECVFRYKSGYADLERTKPLDGRERYNLYSCSKLFTCTAALQLVETGAIKLDAPVYEYLPEFREMTVMKDGKPMPSKITMTVRHLFTMTSGLTYAVNTDNIKRGQAETNGAMPTREAMKYLAKDPLAFEPGEHWNYSLSHDVLAAVVEVASGERFGAYVKRNIFDRIGATRSTFLLPDSELNQIAPQFRYNEETKEFRYTGPQIQGYKLGTQYESGGAGLISTMDDIIAFLEHLRVGETLLRRETIDMMNSPHVSGSVEKEVWLPECYSYGLGVRTTKHGYPQGDFGWGGAAGAIMGIHLAAEVSIFYVQHVLLSPNRELRLPMVSAAVQDCME